MQIASTKLSSTDYYTSSCLFRETYVTKPGNNLYINCLVGQYWKYKPSDDNTSPPFGRACITVLGLIFSGIALPSS